MIGRDTPKLQGWWQAADGTWYPPRSPVPQPPPRRHWWFLVAVAGLAIVVGVAVTVADEDSDETTLVDASPSPAGGVSETTALAQAPSTRPGDLPVGARERLRSGATIQVRSYERGVTAESAAPAAGKRFDAVEVEGCAPVGAPDDGSVVNPFRFLLRLPDDTSVSHGVSVREPAVGFVSLAPGECTRGWITFEVNRSIQPTAVDYASPAGDAAQWRIAG